MSADRLESSCRFVDTSQPDSDRRVDSSRSCFNLCNLRPLFPVRRIDVRVDLTRMVQKLSCSCACLKNEERSLLCFSWDLTYGDTTCFSQSGSSRI